MTFEAGVAVGNATGDRAIEKFRLTTKDLIAAVKAQNPRSKVELVVRREISAADPDPGLLAADVRFLVDGKPLETPPFDAQPLSLPASFFRSAEARRNDASGQALTSKRVSLEAVSFSMGVLASDGFHEQGTLIGRSDSSAKLGRVRGVPVGLLFSSRTTEFSGGLTAQFDALLVGTLEGVAGGSFKAGPETVLPPGE